MFYFKTSGIIIIHREGFMNLNEECLLKYLKNSDDIFYCTNVLKLNNEILEKKFLLRKFFTKNFHSGYNK